MVHGWDIQGKLSISKIRYSEAVNIMIVMYPYVKDLRCKSIEYCINKQTIVSKMNVNIIITTMNLCFSSDYEGSIQEPWPANVNPRLRTERW